MVGRDDWPIGYVVDRASQVVVGSIVGTHLLGGADLASVVFLFNWLITILLFALAAWLIHGFRLKNGFLSALWGAVFYSVVSTIVLRFLGIADVEFTRAALL